MTLEPRAVIEATERSGFQGSVCALLTPMIKVELAKLERGEVLEIRTDDASAKLDVPAWCRLAGHELLATTEEDSLIHFFIRKS